MILYHFRKIFRWHLKLDQDPSLPNFSISIFCINRPFDTIIWATDRTIHFLNVIFIICMCYTGVQKCLAPGHEGYNICTITPCIFCIIVVFLTYRNVSQCTCRPTEQKVAASIEVHRSLRNCLSSVWNLLHVSFLAPTILRWVLDFWKTCGPMTLHSILIPALMFIYCTDIYCSHTHISRTHITLQFEG
jgi:hypothetical protein